MLQFRPADFQRRVTSSVEPLASDVFCSLLESLSAVLAAKAMSLAWTYVSVDSRRYRFCTFLSETPKSSLSRSMSSKTVPNSQSSAIFRRAAVNSAIVSPSFCFLVLNPYLFMIGEGFGWKWVFTRPLISSKEWSCGFPGKQSVLISRYVCEPTAFTSMAHFLAGFPTSLVRK